MYSYVTIPEGTVATCPKSPGARDLVRQQDRLRDDGGVLGAVSLLPTARWDGWGGWDDQHQQPGG